MVDIIVLIIFLVLAALGWQKGFVSSLIGFFGNIAALILAWFLKGSVAASPIRSSILPRNGAKL